MEHELILNDDEKPVLAWLFKDGFAEVKKARQVRLFEEALPLEARVSALMAGVPFQLDTAELKALAAVIEIGRKSNLHILNDMEKAGRAQKTANGLILKIVEAGRSP